MTWANKECDWVKLASILQDEIDANAVIIPTDRLFDIQNYLDHGEYSMAFEYLYLEIMERENTCFILGENEARKIALFFELDNVDECMIDGDFWPKFQHFLKIKNKEENIEPPPLNKKSP